MTPSPRRHGHQALVWEEFHIRSAATEEAIALGHAEVDIDHLLVGLLVVGGPSARSLLAAGADLEVLRKAIRALDEDDLSAFGITASTARTGALAATRSVSNALPLNSRAEDLLIGVSSRADDRELLIALLDDDGLRARTVLRRAGVDTDRLREELARYTLPSDAPGTQGSEAGEINVIDVIDVRGPAPEGAGWMEVTYSQVLPVAPDRVWALVSDALRRAEWDPTSTAVSIDDDGFATVTQQDGSTITQVTTRDEAGRAITWRDNRSGENESSMVREVTLEASGHGTLIRLRASWPVRGRAAGRLSRAVLTRMIRMQLRRQAQGIAHAA